MWLSLVERCVRDAEAAGSNPVISTKMVEIEENFNFDHFYMIKLPPGRMMQKSIRLHIVRS